MLTITTKTARKSQKWLLSFVMVSQIYVQDKKKIYNNLCICCGGAVEQLHCHSPFLQL